MLVGSAVAQDKDSLFSPKDKRIGLVLSGGGAKAMAHIGALRVIDSLGIRLDYIGGTSMGAIIGALYAMGYSPDEIEWAMRSIDWDALMANEMPRQGLSFLDKNTEERYILNFPIRNGKPSLPSAINYGQSILKTLAWLTQKAHHVNRFEDLNIPFFCIATDIEEGKAVVLDTGYLADALRASSAFPSIFSPYELNNKLLADGGLISNFPVEYMRAKGVDYIIGLDVQSVRYTKEDLTSVIKILEQTSGFINAENYKRDLEYVTVLIKPEVPGAGITTFNLMDSIISSGERAARKQVTALVELAKETDRATNRPQGMTPHSTVWIDRIAILGNESSTERFIRGKLNLESPQKKSIKQLNRGIDRLFGTQNYYSVDYRLMPADTGFVLEVRLREKPEKAMWRLGIHYDDDFQTALLVNYTRRNLFLKNSKFSIDVAIGQSPRGLMSYTFDRGFIPTIGVRFRTNQFNYRLYADRRAISEQVYRDFSGEIFLQSTFRDMYAWGGGVQFENVDLSDEVGLFPILDFNRTYLNYFGYVEFDNFNKAFNPTRGTLIQAKYRILSKQLNAEQFAEPTSVLKIKWELALPLGHRVGMIAKAYGATTIGPDADINYNIFLGGMGENYIQHIMPFLGYNFMEIVGRNALVVRADAFYEFIDHHYIQVKGNLGKVESSIDQLFSSSVLLDGYGLGYAYNSPFGPLQFTVMKSTNHADILTYVSLGYWF